MPEFEIPFGVVEGTEPGPRLLVTAGVHGSELRAIETALGLLRLAPEDIRGSIVVLPLLSPQGFTARNIYVMPQDGENLNRMFPGRADGSVSERLAHWLTSYVFPQVDAYVDLHGGDLNEVLVPFTLFPEGSAASAALARAFGFPVSVVAARRGFIINAAGDLGVPSLIAEMGGDGLRDEAEVRRMTDGVLRVMRHLGVARDTIAPPPGAEPRIVTLWSLASPLDGPWYPRAHLGAEVRAGEALGEIRDLLGAVLTSVVSEASGTLLFRMTSLAVNQGEPLPGVGTPVEDDDRRRVRRS